MDVTRNYDMFNQERLFFPVNIGNYHWVLVVVFVQERVIAVFDSMHDKDDKLHGEPRKHENLLLLFFVFSAMNTGLARMECLWEESGRCTRSLQDALHNKTMVTIVGCAFACSLICYQLGASLISNQTKL